MYTKVSEKNHLLILGAVVLIAIAGFLITPKQTATGMVAPGMPVEQKPLLSGAESEEWYKIEFVHYIRAFFNAEDFVYPSDDVCAQVIEHTCDQLKEMKTSKMEVFSAGQQNAYKLILFEVPREILGKITLKKGFETKDSGELHLKLDKTIFTIRGWHDSIEINIMLKGKRAENKMIWEQGNITAEDFECSFGQ